MKINLFYILVFIFGLSINACSSDDSDPVIAIDEYQVIFDISTSETPFTETRTTVKDAGIKHIYYSIYLAEINKAIAFGELSGNTLEQSSISATLPKGDYYISVIASDKPMETEQYTEIWEQGSYLFGYYGMATNADVFTGKTNFTVNGSTSQSNVILKRQVSNVVLKIDDAINAPSDINYFMFIFIDHKGAIVSPMFINQVGNNSIFRVIQPYSEVQESNILGIDRSELIKVSPDTPFSFLTPQTVRIKDMISIIDGVYVPKLSLYLIGATDKNSLIEQIKVNDSRLQQEGIFSFKKELIKDFAYDGGTSITLTGKMFNQGGFHINEIKDWDPIKNETFN